MSEIVRQQVAEDTSTDPRVGVIKPLTDTAAEATQGADAADTSGVPPVDAAGKYADVMKMSTEELSELLKAVTDALKIKTTGTGEQGQAQAQVIQAVDGCSSSTAASATEGSRQLQLPSPAPWMLISQAGAPEIIAPSQNNDRAFLLVDTPAGMMSIPIVVLLQAMQGFQPQALQQAALNQAQVPGNTDLLTLIRQWLGSR